MLSPRPEIVVGGINAVGDTSSVIGIAGPFGRGRMVSALPLRQGPRLITAPVVVHDAGLGYIGDAQGAVIGSPAIRVQRLVDAGTVSDTRRLR